MGKRFFIVIFLISIFFSNVDAQRWKKYRYEFSYGLGLTSFMGDVGAPAENFLTKYIWINPYFFRPIGNVGLGYTVQERLHAKGNLHFGWISADDRYGEYFSRSLKFTSFLIEGSAQAEFYFIKEKRKLNVYRPNERFKRKLQNLSLPTYIFIGVGGAYVNTNLEVVGTVDTDSWTGETYMGKQGTFAVTVPVGMGFKYKLTNRIYAGLEASLRYTLSDQIDNHIPSAGQWIDAYQFLVFSLNYKMKSTRSGLPRFNMSY